MKIEFLGGQRPDRAVPSGLEKRSNNTNASPAIGSVLTRPDRESIDALPYVSATAMAGRTLGRARPSPIATDSGSCPPGTYPKGLLSPNIVKTGYLPAHPVLDEVVNRGTALLLIVLLLPTFALISAANLISSGWPIFYSGDRIGKGGKVFKILKFRTLEVGAQARLSSGTLPKRSRLETRFGSYLRKTRLDELPQLLNVLRGDMAIFGPRPIRPELIPLFSAQSPGFEVRFRVRPGLIGYSQALFPHSASKRLRGRFNAMGCNAPIRYGAAAWFVTIVGWSVIRRSISNFRLALRHMGNPAAKHTFLMSGFATPRNAAVRIGDDPDTAMQGALVSLSDEIIQFVTTLPVETGDTKIEICRKTRRGRWVHMELDARIKTVVPLGLGQSGFAGYATIAPLNDYGRYRLERYFMDQTLVPA